VRAPRRRGGVSRRHRLRPLLHPEDAAAVQRIYELRVAATAPLGVMFFSLRLALASLPELGQGERTVLSALLPGPVTLLLANPRRRYGPACGPDPTRWACACRCSPAARLPLALWPCP